MYDIIGDIHGYADELERLLRKMGYEMRGGCYRHPERKIIFVGDYIDRGPKIRETLQIVRAMTDAGAAIALMGNHEYNALCFHYEESEGGHLRKHEIKNIIQHYETLKQFQNRQEEYNSYIDWFMTLPLYFEDKNIRVVHACWDADNIDYLRKTLVKDCLNEELLKKSVVKESRLHEAIEETLKGKELRLPLNSGFQDKDGNERREIRVRWWDNAAGKTYRAFSVESADHIPDENIPDDEARQFTGYPETERPVFFGHYWLKGEPKLFKPNVCCLDYSVAKGGVLVGWRGETKAVFNEVNFVVA